MRFTIDRKSWYSFVAGEFTEEDFAKVCTLSAKAVRSELYEKKMEFDAIFDAQTEMIERLGNSLSLERIKAVVTGVDSTNHSITDRYIAQYPLETQFEYNSKLLDLEPKMTEEDINNMTEEQKTAMLLKLLVEK